jgi:hypothetical protein
MAYDIDSRSWRKPMKLTDHKIIGQAQVANDKSLDAMIVRKKSLELFVFQGDIYASVEYRQVCDNKDGYGSDQTKRNITDIMKSGTLDAATAGFSFNQIY